MKLSRKLSDFRLQVKDSRTFKKLSAKTQDGLVKANEKTSQVGQRIRRSDTYKDLATATREGMRQASRRLAGFRNGLGRKTKQERGGHSAGRVRDSNPVLADNRNQHLRVNVHDTRHFLFPGQTSNAPKRVVSVKEKNKKNRLVYFGMLAGVAVFIGIALIGAHSEYADEPAASSGSSSMQEETERYPDSAPPSAPQYEVIDTTAFKGRDAKEVIKDVKEKNLGVTTAIIGDVDTQADRTEYIVANTNDSKRWLVTDAMQNSDGSISLKVREKTNKVQKKIQPKPSQTPTPPGPLTSQNNPELKALLALKDPQDPTVQEFAKKYRNKTIEFDGNIASIQENPSYPNMLIDGMLIHAGDYSEDTALGPEFKIENASYDKFKGASNTGFPGYVETGSNVHVRATVDEYNPNQGILILDLETVDAR